MWWIIPLVITCLSLIFPFKQTRNTDLMMCLISAIDDILIVSAKIIITLSSWLIYCILRIWLGIV